MGEERDITRREAMGVALKTGAYAAPVVLTAIVPQAVGASPPPVTVDLAVGKDVFPTSQPVPSLVKFTITVINNGPVAASTITIMDVLDPTAFRFATSAPSVGTYDRSTAIWSIPALAVGTTATLIINATALLVGPQTSSATLTASTPADATAANNTASTTFTGIARVASA